MKRILILLTAVLLFAQESKASHLYGGEITWECLANGKFVFKLDIYRECSGVPFGYSQNDTEILEIVGSSRPRNQNNGIMNSITVTADWNRFVNANNGDITPQCPDPNGISLQCSNGDVGAIQRLPFISAPIELRGTPPVGGWTFKWDGFARPPTENIPQVALGLRATMYRIPNPNGATPPFLPVDNCADASPRFAELPAIQICRGYEFTYNHNAVDNELDSLVYSWDHPVNQNLANIGQMNGFTFDNPLPDQRFNSANIPATLNPLTGEMKQAIYSGSGPKAYGTVVRVDAWRCGQVIASIWRDIPFLLFDCPVLPQSGKVNNPPLIEFDGSRNGDTLIEVFAGELVEVGFRSIDNDLNFNNSPPFQKNTLEPSGFLFSKNFANPTFCETANIQPCATLTPPPIQTPGQPYKLTDLSGINTQFRWQTDCNHIAVTTGGACGGGTGQVGATDGLFNFVMKTYDDHCPIRAINYPVITVKVKAPITLTDPIVKGASVGFNGRINLQWAPPIDSATTFDHYSIEGGTVNNGTPAGGFITVQNNVTKYKKELDFPYLNFPQNIWTPFPANKDYYFRMKTFSGCSGNEPSGFSQPVRVIEVDAQQSGPVAGNAQATRATLTWNAPKPNNAQTKSYFEYESPTWYYIHEHQDILNGPTNPANWQVIASTKNRTFTRTSPVCGDFVGYRIEARDTIITFVQGTRIPQGRFDTLTFSTFSIIDTVYLNTISNPPKPVLDTIQVLANGDVYFKIDLSNTGSAGGYEFYDISSGTAVLVGTITLPTASFTHVGANVNTGVQANSPTYRVRALDKCSNATTDSDPIKAFVPSIAKYTDPNNLCDQYAKLDWPVMVGMSAGSPIRYKVFRSVGSRNGPYTQIAGNLSARTYTDGVLAAMTDYYYYVIAENTLGEVNISEIGSYSIGVVPTDENLRAPDVRCVEVLPNGNVKINWLPFDPATYDTTNSFVGYRIGHKLSGSTAAYSYVANTLIKSDTTFTITGINAQTSGYDIEVASLANNCGDDKAPSNNPTVVQTIDLNVTANVDKTGDLVWNSTGVANLNDYQLFKDLDPNSGYNKPLFNTSSTENFIDNTNGAYCADNIYYYVDIFDDLGQCISRSNIDNDLFQDAGPPPAQLADYVTVLDDGSVEIYWSTPSANDVDSLNFIIPDGSGGFNGIAGSLFDVFGKKYHFDLATLDASNSTQTVGIQPYDACDNPSVDADNFDYHTTMDIDVVWNACDSVMELNWNAYEWFNVGEGVEYRVSWDTSNADNFALAQAGITDTTYKFKVGPNFKVGANGLLFTFYVTARPTGSGAQSFVSRSNRASETASFASTPRYDYMHYANVLSKNEVEIQVLPDKAPAIFTNIGQYVIYRGNEKKGMVPIGSIDKTEVIDPTFRFYDYTAQTSEYSYFYRVVVENTCGGPVDTSNFGRTIHLNVVPDNEALTNTLSWNEYEEWDSTVAFYNVYRSFNGSSYIPYEVVPPKSPGKINNYVDDVYDELFAIGDFCYFVEAVQGPVTTDFGINAELDPAISRSNEVCVVQKPLFYVPNAFAPDGVNKVFGPIGQFVDWRFFEMIIYNRWGEQVYITNDPTKGWDGKVNGQDPALGSYVYTIRFQDAEGNEHRRKGTVTVIK